MAEKYKANVDRIKSVIAPRDIAGDIESERAMNFVKENAVEKAAE